MKMSSSFRSFVEHTFLSSSLTFQMRSFWVCGQDPAAEIPVFSKERNPTKKGTGPHPVLLCLQPPKPVTSTGTCAPSHIPVDVKVNPEPGLPENTVEGGETMKGPGEGCSPGTRDPGINPSETNPGDLGKNLEGPVYWTNMWHLREMGCDSFPPI